jgi:hypothetical protein
LQQCVCSTDESSARNASCRAIWIKYVCCICRIQILNHPLKIGAKLCLVLNCASRCLRVADPCTTPATISNGIFPCSSTPSGQACNGTCNTGYSGTPRAACTTGVYTVTGSCQPGEGGGTAGYEVYASFMMWACWVSCTCCMCNLCVCGCHAYCLQWSLIC